MAMVSLDSGSLYRRTHLVLGQRLLGAVLHSSNEPSELSRWLCHDDSTINIVLELLLLLSFSSRMRVIYHNWSATKQHPHPQSVAEISRHSVLLLLSASLYVSKRGAY